MKGIRVETTNNIEFCSEPATMLLKTGSITDTHKTPSSSQSSIDPSYLISQ